MKNVKQQAISKGEKKCIDYCLLKGVRLSEKKSYVYYVGKTWISQNKEVYKQFEKSYTPDIEFELNGKRYFIEIKGYRQIFIKGKPFWLNDDTYEEKRPLIIDYCINNEIIFKQFSSSNEEKNKNGLNDFKNWIDSLLGDKNG